MEKFEEILVKYNCPLRTAKPLTTIDQLESYIKFKLPSDYTTYIQNYLGFGEFIGPEYVVLWDFDELLEANKGSGIVDNLSNTIGIGGNGAGEFIAIEIMNNDDYRIVLAPLIGMDKIDYIEIGKSFTDFLVRLENGREWFEKINITHLRQRNGSH